MEGMATWQCLAGMLRHGALLLFLCIRPSIHSSCSGLQSKGQLHEAPREVLRAWLLLLFLLGASHLPRGWFRAAGGCSRGGALHNGHDRPTDSAVVVHLLDLSLICVLHMQMPSFVSCNLQISKQVMPGEELGDCITSQSTSMQAIATHTMHSRTHRTYIHAKSAANSFAADSSLTSCDTTLRHHTLSEDKGLSTSGMTGQTRQS